MYDDFDYEVKRLIHESEDIEVPNRISEGIDQIFNELMVKSDKGIKKTIKMKNFKIIIIAACLVLVTTISINLTFPAMADEIPVLNKVLGSKSLFNKLSKSQESSDFKNQCVLQDMSSEVNKSVTDKGITVTLKEIACDDTAFYVIYEAKSLTSKKNVDFNERSTIVVNNKKFMPDGGFLKCIDNNTTDFMEMYPITGGNVIGDKYKFSMKLTNVLDVKGHWNFDLSLSRSGLSQKSSIITLNKRVNLPGDNIKVSKITVSPLFTAVVSEHSKNRSKYITDSDKYIIALMDSKGGEIDDVDSGGIVDKGKKSILTEFYRSVDNVSLDEIIFLKAKVGIFSSNTLNNHRYIPLNSSLPVKVEVGSNKYISIDKIYKGTDKITIEYSANDFPAYNFSLNSGISLYNSKKDKTDNHAYFTLRPESLGAGKYKIEFNYTGDLEFDSIAVGNYDEVLEEVGKINIR